MEVFCVPSLRISVAVSRRTASVQMNDRLHFMFVMAVIVKRMVDGEKMAIRKLI